MKIPVPDGVRLAMLFDDGGIGRLRVRPVSQRPVCSTDHGLACRVRTQGCTCGIALPPQRPWTESIQDFTTLPRTGAPGRRFVEFEISAP